MSRFESALDRPSWLGTVSGWRLWVGSVVLHNVGMAHDLSRIDAHRFEEMVLALGVRVLGPGLRAYGAGADGGREATFEGLVPYPFEGPKAWEGYGVVQAKCRRTSYGIKDAEWLIQQIKKEIHEWLDPASRRAQTRRPEYLIFATNVRLTSTVGTGGIDKVNTFMQKCGSDLGCSTGRYGTAISSRPI